MEEQVRRHGAKRRQEAQGFGGGKQKAQEAGGRAGVGQYSAQGRSLKKVVRPKDKKLSAQRMVSSLGLSKTKACSLTGLVRSTYHYQASDVDKDTALKERIKQLAAKWPSFGRSPGFTLCLKLKAWWSTTSTRSAYMAA